MDPSMKTIVATCILIGLPPPPPTQSISPSLRRASLLLRECAIAPPACRGATLRVVVQRSPPLAGASAAIAARCSTNTDSCNWPVGRSRSFSFGSAEPRRRNAGVCLCRTARFARLLFASDARGLDNRPPFLDFGSLQRGEHLRRHLLARK